jgi:hypothetical protein
MGANAVLSAMVRRSVEHVLTARFGTRVRIAGVEAFPHYAHVARYTLAAAGGTVPQTAIVRVARTPAADPARSGVGRLHNERTALEFLASIGSTLAPGYVAGDTTAGILVTEDLGTHPSLLDLLLGSDEEAARRGLLAFARALGTLHAQTVGHATAYGERRMQLDPANAYSPDTDTTPPIGPVAVVEHWRRVQDAVTELGLPRPHGVDRDVGQVIRTLDAPGPYLALSSGDPSPVNCKVAGGAVRFFDFEAAGFRHALVDATVLRYPYPTGGPVWRLPDDTSRAVEAAYREALACACPAALDDAGYERDLAAACAAWTIVRTARLPRVEAGPDRGTWPLVPAGWSAPLPTRSRRRQLVAILETCSAAARQAGTLETLAVWCDSLVDALRARWPEATEDVPLFPAFT